MSKDVLLVLRRSFSSKRIVPTKQGSAGDYLGKRRARHLSERHLAEINETYMKDSSSCSSSKDDVEAPKSSQQIGCLLHSNESRRRTGLHYGLTSDLPEHRTKGETDDWGSYGSDYPQDYLTEDCISSVESFSDLSCKQQRIPHNGNGNYNDSRRYDHVNEDDTYPSYDYSSSSSNHNKRSRGEHNKGGDIHFLPRGEFNFDYYPQWYPGHMGTAKVDIKKRVARGVNLIIEVRDARAPFSTCQSELLEECLNFKKEQEQNGYLDCGGPLRGEGSESFPGNNSNGSGSHTGSGTHTHLHKLIVFNKADLISMPDAKKILRTMDYLGKPAIMVSATDKMNIDKIVKYAIENVKPKYPNTIGIWMMVVGLPNVGKSSILNELKELSFSMGTRLGDGRVFANLKRGHKARVEKRPGVTKWLEGFQICSVPRIHCIDTPGVSFVKKNDVVNSSVGHNRNMRESSVRFIGGSANTFSTSTGSISAGPNGMGVSGPGPGSNGNNMTQVTAPKLNYQHSDYLLYSNNSRSIYSSLTVNSFSSRSTNPNSFLKPHGENKSVGEELHEHLHDHPAMSNQRIATNNSDARVDAQYVENIRKAMNLALIGCMPDHLSGELYVGDYLLYLLNKNRNYRYVEVCNLKRPSNCIKEVSRWVNQTMQPYLDCLDILAGVRCFLILFRNGHFGPIVLDDMPGTRVGESGNPLKDLHKKKFVTEPPNPWTTRYNWRGFM